MSRNALSVGILIVNVIVLGMTSFNMILMSDVSNKLARIDEMEKSIARIDKSVVNPAYKGDLAKDIPEDNGIYMQQVTQEYLLYQLCYGDPMYAFTDAKPFTSNQKCPTLN